MYLNFQQYLHWQNAIMKMPLTDTLAVLALAPWTEQHQT
jgi:hypothetical protein